MSAHCSVSSCVLARHISRTRTMAQVMSLSSHPHVHVHGCVSPRLALPFYFTHFLPHSFHFLLHLRFVDNLRIPPKESMDLSDEFLLSTEGCFDCLARVTSKELCTNSFCEKWHPPVCLFNKSENGCRFGTSALMRIARLKNSLSKVFKKEW